jgi:hypothetical protein
LRQEAGNFSGLKSKGPNMRKRLITPEQQKSAPSEKGWLDLEGIAEVEITSEYAERSQEYVLRWSGDGGKSFRDIVRQQWNFNPEGASTETEDHQVELPAVSVLELSITPDRNGGSAIASRAQLRLA